ncbi:SusD/RagB family nutrient-binding outer membrane lipoprotein [Porphyromonadaceae sp. NP-X]|nr:SusD/RagB family nutrient-binding outer membrane lipoprotein [Porphyromonadaceae sp. NP-X]
MKRIKFYNIAALMISVLLLAGCSDSFFDINKDPNNPADATPGLTLPSGLANSAYVIGGYYHALGSFWTQQYAQAPAASQWADWESYNLTQEDFDRQFILLYSGGLYDYEYVRKISSATGNWKYYTIATLMQAYTFQVLADLYDQIPFTEALQGTVNPHYDNGQLVYDSLLARIDHAVSKDFSLSSVENPGSSDLIFGGNINDWKAFANTLKLKIYLRYVNVDSIRYEPEIKALLAENNFLTKDAKFSAFKDEETGYNPFYNTFVDRLSGNVIANKTLIDTLKEKNDPRYTKLFKPSVTGNLYNGMASGDNKNHPTETSKNYATPAITGTSPVYFFSKEEVLFLIAEAQARYGTASEAENTYKSAIQASLTSLGLAADAINIDTTYPYNGIQSIIEQKWIAQTNKNGIEAFFDYNRTGYPNFFTRSLTSVLSGDQRPKRLYFPSREVNSNPYTPTRVAITVPVWWAK